MAAVAGALAVGVATSTLPRWATGLVLLSSLGGFLLVVAGVLRVITVDDSAYTVGLINSDVSYSGEVFAPLGTIYRDDLRLVSSEGYSQGFGYGLWLGMALIVLQLLASVTLLARSREVTASPAGCGAWTHASLLGFAVLGSPPRPSYDGPQPGR